MLGFILLIGALNPRQSRGARIRNPTYCYLFKILANNHRYSIENLINLRLFQYSDLSDDVIFINGCNNIRSNIAKADIELTNLEI